MTRSIVVFFAVLAVVAASVGALVASKAREPCDGFAPDAQAWRATSDRGDRPTPRQRYARRVVRCRAALGWNRTRVRAVFGRSVDRYRREWAYPTGSDWLGDQTLLVFLFDRRGTVQGLEHNDP